MTADRGRRRTNRSRFGNNDEVDNNDGNLSVTPTPQPWDPPSDIRKMKVTVDNDLAFDKTEASVASTKSPMKKRAKKRRRSGDDDANMDSE